MARNKVAVMTETEALEDCGATDASYEDQTAALRAWAVVQKAAFFSAPRDEFLAAAAQNFWAQRLHAARLGKEILVVNDLS